MYAAVNCNVYIRDICYTFKYTTNENILSILQNLTFLHTIIELNVKHAPSNSPITTL